MCWWRMSRRRAGSLMQLLALGGLVGCASLPSSQQERLKRSGLGKKCELVRMAAKLSYRFAEQITPESIPDGICARETAQFNGKIAMRVQVERITRRGAVRSPFFRGGETCSWPDLELVSHKFDEVDKTVGAVVTLLFFAEDRDGIPFRVGVEPRDPDDENPAVVGTSICGVMDGRLAWSSGGWHVTRNLNVDD